jgi:hypothetical protein
MEISRFTGNLKMHHLHLIYFLFLKNSTQCLPVGCVFATMAMVNVGFGDEYCNETVVSFVKNDF